MNRCCDKCGQPLPAEVRRDPPLPPLDHPAVLTIHDLPAGTKYRVKQLGLEPGGYRVKPDGTIDVYAASQKADNDDFDAQFKERL
jgi:hypothetical protein